MQIKLTTYQADHQALDLSTPDYMEKLRVWSADYNDALVTVEKSIAAVVAAAIEHQFALLSCGQRPAADALSLDVDRVLDAMSPAMLAQFDALHPSNGEDPD